jgi:hypothetical protein
MNLRELTRLPLAALAAMALLIGALPARADNVADVPVPRQEIPDAVLRGVIGVATIQVEPDHPALRRFEPTGSGDFQPAGVLALETTAPISGWMYGEESLSRYPVVEQRGRFLRVIIDYTNQQKAWIEWPTENPPRMDISFQSFEDPSTFEATGIDIRSLLREDEQPVFLSEPRVSAPRARVPKSSLSDFGWLRLLRREGDFVEIGLLEDPGTEETRPLGWIRLTDKQGTLRIWPTIPECC